MRRAGFVFMARLKLGAVPGGLSALLMVLFFAFAQGESPRQSTKGTEHWAFQAIHRPSLPPVREQYWVQTPIDAFVLARLESAGVRPAPTADKRTLLRRVYFDLIGLPPAAEEQRAFLADVYPDAFARVVDRLLASPAYGERWARYWLDVVRYADTNGYERDGDKPNAWRYRDYVIDALNRDLPFDRFILEQVAGDELPDADARTRIATTFLRLGTWDDEPADEAIDRYEQLDDVLGVTTTAFLAQTIRCARCHDHKFEPFTQADYYRLLAVFERLRRPQRKRDDLDLPVGTESELVAYQKAKSIQNEKRLALEKRLAAAQKPLLARVKKGEGRLTAAVRAAFLVEPGKQTAAQKQLLKKSKQELDQAIQDLTTPEERNTLAALQRELEELERSGPIELPRAYIWQEDGPKAPVTRILRRGNPAFPGAEVQPGIPAILEKAASSPRVLEARPLTHSTGRRLALARWIASENNPLTARVIVNRVWQQHFGKGLVATANDFGTVGEKPSHPELLDWLAAEFIAKGWSLKHLHRLIVTSAAYQTDSRAQNNPGESDPALALFGRWRQHRLEAEVLRDAAHAISGQLNREMGGPGVYPTLPAAVLATQSRPGQGWGRAEPSMAARRSVYVFAKRSLVPPELDLLDVPDNTSPCEQRSPSTTAPQALTLLNGAFFNEQASHFANRLLREAGSAAEEQIRLAFELALARQPRAEELELIRKFLDKQEQQLLREAKGPLSSADLKRRILASFCLVLLNSNEFAYPG